MVAIGAGGRGTTPPRASGQGSLRRHGVRPAVGADVLPAPPLLGSSGRGPGPVVATRIRPSTGHRRLGWHVVSRAALNAGSGPAVAGGDPHHRALGGRGPIGKGRAP